MFSSIKEFIVDKIFSGRKRKRFNTSVNKIEHPAFTNLTEKKLSNLRCSNFKSFVKEDIIDLTNVENPDSQYIQLSREITMDEIFKVRIHISSTEFTFHEKLNSFSKIKNDISNYPPIGIQNFIKLLR